MQSPTFRLFKRLLSLVDGVTAAISFDADLYRNFNTDKDAATADMKALAADWQAVGSDLHAALKKYAERTAANR